MCLLACHSSVADGFTIPQKAKSLLQILVEELPKHGGWPEGVAAMAQDADGAVQNYSDTDDIRIDSIHAYGNSRIPYSYSIGSGEVSAASDRLTAIITREQYEAALAASKEPLTCTGADGWIDWAGGKIPLDKKALVDLKFRDSVEYKEVDAGDFYWPHTNSLSDIIAYRLHQPQEVNSRANDERLDAAVGIYDASKVEIEESDLNECIGQTPEDTTLLMHFLLDEINDADVNMRLDDAYELAQHLISVGYRKQ